MLDMIIKLAADFRGRLILMFEAKLYLEFQIWTNPSSLISKLTMMLKILKSHKR
jgi:hypothetical protein